MDKPLTVAQAAEFLNLSRGYLYNMVQLKKIPSHKPNGKKLYFKLSDLEAYAYGKRTPTDCEVNATADKLLSKGKNRSTKQGH